MTEWIEGIDAAWSRPTPSQMTAAGKRFIVGYVSHDASKNLTRANCQAYLNAGISVGLVWETTTNRALAGNAAGLADGKEARSQANALGFPADRPIFTAVDFDASHAQLTGPVDDYLTGFAKGVGGFRLAGVYGGIKTVKYVLDEDLMTWGWQTYAWSNGKWDPRAYAQQYRNGVNIAGHDTDLDRTRDLSAFWTKDSDMAGTAITTDNTLTETWNGAIIPPVPGSDAGTAKSSAGTALQLTRNTALTIDEKADKILQLLETSTTQPLPGGITLDDVRRVVREELDKTKLAGA
jgi:hypothetical protein